MQTVQMALYNFTCVAVKIRNFLFFIVFNLCVDEALNGAATKSTKASEGDVHKNAGNSGMHETRTGIALSLTRPSPLLLQFERRLQIACVNYWR